MRLPDAAVVVPNSGGETYARLRLDEQSWAALAADLASVPDDDTRAIVWSTAFDMVRCGDLPAAEFLGLLTRHLPRERRVGIVDGGAGLDARRPWSPATSRPTRSSTPSARVAAACETGLASEPEQQVAVSLTLGLARTTPDAVLLQRWLLDRETHTGIARRARPALGRDPPAGRARRDRRSTRSPTSGSPTAPSSASSARPTALAALPTAGGQGGHLGAADRRAGAVQPRVRGDRRRASGTPSRPRWSTRTSSATSPSCSRLARTRGQAFSHLVARAFPAVPLLDEHVAALEQALTGDVPTVLRRGWEDSLDDLHRAAAAEPTAVVRAGRSRTRRRWAVHRRSGADRAAHR